MFVASKQADEQKKLIIEQEVQKRQFQKIEELKTDMQKGVNPFLKSCLMGGIGCLVSLKLLFIPLYLYCL